MRLLGRPVARCIPSVLGAAGAALAWSAPAGGQTWQDHIGYTSLKAALGDALPKGAGVTVTLVESSVSVADPDRPGETVEYFRPSAEATPQSGNFAGKVFDFRTGPDGVSWHAQRVGNFFFGLNHNAAAGEASVAPLAGTGPAASVICHQATDWMATGSLRHRSPSLPRPENGRVVNHSWISDVDDELSADAANDLLRRVDYQAQRDGHVVVAGVNNGPTTPMPAVLASAYNVLAVGVTGPGTYGGHSTGSSSIEVDGGGRLKPELVAPLPATSYATAVVSSCAALLTGVAAADPELADAARSEVIRALLLAGTRKDRVTSWTRTDTRPLDAYYGAGEVNILRSYQSLLAGRPVVGQREVAGASGWVYGAALEPGAAASHTLVIPDGCVAEEFSAALVWNRQLDATPGGLGTGRLTATFAPTLANLDLRLRASSSEEDLARSLSGADGSVSHPLEYLYLHDMPAGAYVLEVSHQPGDATAASPAYGLAWWASLRPAAPAELSLRPMAQARDVQVTFAHLGTGLSYRVEHSTDLSQWSEAHTFVAPATSFDWTTTLAASDGYFRLSLLETPVAAPVVVTPQVETP